MKKNAVIEAEDGDLEFENDFYYIRK